MDDMTVFLQKCTGLKYLELEAHGMNNLADGNQWEMLTSSLIKFHFRFFIQNFSNFQSLDSFRTSFWLEEKHWYVASQNGCLFSIPHFPSNEIEISIESSIYSTAPGHIIICNHITEVIVNSVPIDISICFTNVKTLRLKSSISIDTLSSIINLNQIEHLTILSINDLLEFLPFECRMTRLYELRISTLVTIDMIRRFRNYHFEHIRKLYISIKVEYYRFMIENLFILFPNIEHLIIGVSKIESIKSIVYVIDRFSNLNHLSFYSFSLSPNVNTIICNNPKSIIYFSRRLTENNFTCRINRFMTSIPIYNINWWIDAKV
jgi:hypothetical protein